MAKAMTLKQPWAELVVLGAKRIETRPFGTEHRGELYIHASSHFHFSDLELCYQDESFNRYVPSPHTLRTGMIIGKVHVTDVKQMDDYLIDQFRSSIPGREQIVFGDWKPGRYAWFLSGAEKFANPVRVKGALSLWSFDDTEFDFKLISR